MDINSGPDPGSLQDMVDQDQHGSGDVGDVGDEDENWHGMANRPEDDDNSDEEGTEGNPLPETANLEHLQLALMFIKDLQNANLDNGKLDPETLHRLRNPTQQPLAIDDEDLLLAIRLFFATSNASQEVYNSSRIAILLRHPDDPILTYYQIKKKVQELSGVIIMEDDMCPKSCIAYTGTAYGSLEACPKCGTGRWDPQILASSHGRKKVAQQKFCTIALGPIVQSMCRTIEGCKLMDYFWKTMVDMFDRPEVVDPTTGKPLIGSYKDFCFGSELTDAFARGDILRHDTLLMFSIDGAQIYKGKKSDCWIYIWVVLNLSPDLRYKKKYIIPGGFIPGPNHPKDTDSFVFPGFHHIAALQKEGLKIWKASLNQVVNSNLFLTFFTADGVGLNELNGFAGHMAAFGCRKYCGVKGRRKPGASNYYPAHLKPSDYDVEGCNHGDVDIWDLAAKLEPTHEKYQQNLAYLLESQNITQYNERRLETGLSKPSLFLGIASNCRLDIPVCFPIDLMHLVALNVPQLLLSLYRGKLPGNKKDKESWTWAVLQGDVWTSHGALVAKAAPYLPGSFDKAPRNPAEKISSGYKAWEYLIYVYGLCPAFLKTVLPDLYWEHLCKLAVAMRILHQHTISVEEVQRAYDLIVDFVETFEDIFYQRKTERIHFCRQSVHGLLHCPFEVRQLGPHPLRSQWPMERTIGNLGEEIKQDVNPYKNLSERGCLRAILNSLRIMFPVLDKPEKGLPRGALDLGGGFQLRRAMDTCDREILGKKRKPFFNTFTGVELEALLSK